MKIGIDFRMAGTHHGGIGRYVLELVRHLLALDVENEYYLFFNDDAQTEMLKVKGQRSKVVCVKTNVRHYSLAEQIKLPLQLNKYNLDLMHFPNFNVPLLYRRPFVVTIHDLIHHKLGGVKKSNLLHFAAYRKIIASAINQSRRIITVSGATKNDIMAEFKVPAEKVKVIYEGLALKTLPNPKQIAEVKQTFHINKPYFLFVGVRQRNKNLPGLCRGFRQFLNGFGLNFDLVAAGKADPHYPDIKGECLEILDSKHLVFTGQLADDQLAALYAGAYAFVSASLLEGFGLPGIEAMHYGLPLVVSNLPVFNEIYEDGAIYFDPQSPENIAQCLNLLAQDRLYYMQVKQKALERSKFFSWEKCARETLEVYQSIVG